MSVIIHGMEIPKNCMMCPLSFMRGERLFCQRTKGEVVRAKIDPACPLVEVPHHGDLIDREALYEVLGGMKECAQCEYSSTNGCKYIYGADVCNVLDEAQVIIPKGEA